jgi:hypothetical protein
METRFVQCRTCGAELDLATGECPYCPPAKETPAAAGTTPSAPPPEPAAATSAAPAPAPATPATTAAPAPQTPGPPAQPELELERVARNQVRQALDAAREAVAAGWHRKAQLALQRALRIAPDDPELLAMLREVEQGLPRETERPRSHPAAAQIQAGLDLLAEGKFDASLETLRAVLKDDPDNVSAQEAIQKVRGEWLKQHPDPDAAPKPAPAPSAPAAPPRPAPPAAQAPAPATRPAGAPTPRPRLSSSPGLKPPTGTAALPREVLLPRVQRSRVPVGLVIGVVVLLAAAAAIVVSRSGSGPAPRAASSAPPATHGTSGPDPLEEELARFAGVDDDLRSTALRTLKAYATAVESMNADRLAQARPDLSAAEREARLSHFAGALNATTDLRILDVAVRGDAAEIVILATDVVVGSKEPAPPPREETLRFERRSGAWSLKPR